MDSFLWESARRRHSQNATRAPCPSSDREQRTQKAVTDQDALMPKLLSSVQISPLNYVNHSYKD